MVGKPGGNHDAAKVVERLREERRGFREIRRDGDLALGDMMIDTKSRHGRTLVNVGLASLLAVFLAGCSTFGTSQQTATPEPAAPPEIPSTIRAAELVGNWGLASYQNPNDRARTEAAARAQCKNPYVIAQGPSGGVIMHLADEATPQELRLKGSQSGRNYIGPEGPAGGERDREIISFDGRVLVTRFIDKDAGTRYGNMVYVRCAPHA